ncbi:MAG: phosphohydrolase [Alphaproteobacteria bacterium]|jgi:oligoribonuclease NrnB/cAMP/cGMP phosphodiesterase (DHH superfamily)|nr:phosphohydrolase [Rhodospirillaceae bacterium]MDP6407247.1 phosphohydrolase [Alphaproteobacteria bacterium]MDP6623693.1 phosphohydrolase [Alphaproteobacteria bacterium]|tara:strand:- start:810 stop:1673 length:864 start_codon:yes stop_codon:yes gene_type:complete
MNPLCIYHGNCADGFGAAWAVWKRYGDDVEFHAGVHQDPPPAVAGRDVFMVDFSYKRSVLTEMGGKAKSIVILDHHTTAAEDLEAFTQSSDGGWQHSVIHARFDMERSGVMMAWEHFHPDKEAPAILRHIQDLDLWRFDLPGTREILAALLSHPYDFGLWDGLMQVNLEDLQREGEAIERKHHKDVAELVGVSRRRMVIGGYDVPAANLPYTLASDAGNLMAKGEPFACCYMDTPDGRLFELRSVDGGVDVSKIAAQYGGGGHLRAAGFRTEIGWEGQAGSSPECDT